MMPGGLAEAIIGAISMEPPKLSKSEKKKIRKRKVKWAENCMSMIDVHGITTVLFVGGRPMMNNGPMVARTTLMLCGHSAALKASFAACDCETCQKVAAYPEHAILEGYREWFGGMAKGEHDGQNPDLLLATILRKVEPQ